MSRGRRGDGRSRPGTPHALGSKLSGPNPAEIGFVRVGRSHHGIKLSQGAEHLENHPEAYAQVTALELGDRGTTDAGPLSKLFPGQVLQLSPRRDVLAHLERSPWGVSGVASVALLIDAGKSAG